MPRLSLPKGAAPTSDTDARIEEVLAQAVKVMKQAGRQVENPRPWLAALDDSELELEVFTARDAEPLPRGLDWWAPSDDTAPTLEIELPPEPLPEPVVEEDPYRTTVRVGSRDSDSVVVHVAPISDLLQRSSFRGVATGHGIVPQELLRLPKSDVIVSLRELVNGTLADDMAKLDRESTKGEPGGARSLKARIDVLRMVLVGLESLHTKRLLHGNLHPENIARNGQVLDYLVRPPIERLTPEQRVYLAPEVYEGQNLPASDVYAFGKLAQRLLGSYLWDSRILPNGLDSDAFEWLLDYCTVEDPGSRPSVKMLIEILAGGSVDLAARATRSIRSGARIAFDELRPKLPEDDAGVAVADAADHLGELVGRFPETSVAVSSTRQALSLIHRLTLDRNLNLAHNLVRSRQGLYQDMERFEDNKTGIDTQWRDRIHRQFFGVGIPIDAGRSDVPRLTRPAVAKEYREQIEKLGDARRNLLSKDSYVYSLGVAERLSTENRVATAAEVAVLRRWGHVLAVPDHGRWIYPEFQFDEMNGIPVEIESANKTLMLSGPWEVLSFWHIPRPSLDGATFASVLHTPEGKVAIEKALARLADPTRSSGAANE